MLLVAKTSRAAGGFHYSTAGSSEEQYLVHSSEVIAEQDTRTKKRPAVMAPPSRIEVSALWLLAVVLFLLTLVQFQSYTFKVDNFGDNPAYLKAASAIQHWDFRDAEVKLFWGLPYVVAGLSWLPVSARTDLLLICLVSSLISVLLVRELWGPWIAGYFAVLSFRWIQVSVLGGNEPLFVALLFSSFWASRKERWLVASLLAALATLVRPLGIFALIGIGVTLLYRRDYKKDFQCTALAAFIGALYLLPFWLYFHDPLYQFHLYKQRDWQSGSAIGLPFRAIAISFMHNREPWTNVIVTMAWIIFAFAGLCAMASKTFRQYIRKRRAECIFGFLYLFFIFSYNSVSWARAEFPRFVIPVIPLLLLALERWLPKSRYVLYGLGIVSAVLGACSAVGIRNVLPALR
jgi:hypothetical protein